MPVNKNALLRYRILDDCLRRRNRRWTIDDLCEEVAHRMTDLTGKNTISKRTIDGDLAEMKEGGRTGYNAPIICDKSEGRGYYSYADPAFSIENSPLTSDDAEVVHQVLDVLAPFQSLPLLAELAEVAERLRQRTGAVEARTSAVLHFDTVPDYAGACWLGPLYEAIRAREVIRFTYQPFGQAGSSRTVHPYLLKQYNHRWFLLGQCADLRQLQNFALDRILGERIERLPTQDFWPNQLLDPATYFNEVIGASVPPPDQQVQQVRLHFTAERAPYVITKPLHPSQSEAIVTAGGTEVCLQVRLNRELTSLLLGFGADVEVLAPEALRENLRQVVQQMMRQYVV